MLTGIDPDRALELVLEQTHQAGPVEVELLDAQDRVLAEAVHADRDYPPFARAMMDGFAVRASDAGRPVRVVGEVAAGEDPTISVDSGAAVAIMTGAPCPPGTESVVPVEQVERTADGVRLPADVVAGQHIVPRGSEREAGAVVAQPGAVVTPLCMAALASVGRQRVHVTAPPTLAVISTGNEVVDPGSAPRQSQIRNSNGPMLAAAARRLGVDQVMLLHAEDTALSLSSALDRAASDIVLLSGGVSAGRYDLVPEALEQAGATIVFHKVTQKPGKPLLLARRQRQLFFGLPGNPLSSHFCFVRYVAAAVRRMTGAPEPPADRGELAGRLTVSCERTLFLASRVRSEGEGWRVSPLVVGSGNIFACVDARAYLRLEPGRHDLAAGTPVDFQWM